MDRRSTKSLWRDYGVPMQDPNAFSLQYYKDTSRDPSKPAPKKSPKKKKVDYTDHTGILKIQKPKKAKEGTKMIGLLKKGGKVGDPKNRNKPGGSNVGKYSKSEGPFAGPSGGAPAGSYPIGSKARGKSALKLAHNAPNPSGIKAAVYRKYPDLKPKKAMEGAKLGLLGMGQMQGKAPQPTDRKAPADKTNFIFSKKKRKEPKTIAFGH
jgi:hypothetical protein